jgi:antitoxin (DNA-binding transcriptional repressor) of toxin-antitoxin stability system
MVQQAIKNAAMDLDKVVQAARSGQLTLLLDGGKPIAYVGSGLCSRSDLTSAILTTRPECPSEFRIERRKLAHQWPAVMQKARERNVIVVTEGRVLAGIVADDGPAVLDTIRLGNSARHERDAAIVAGREIQLRKRNQVVARIIPPARIPEFLPGWTVPEPEPLSRHKANGEEKRRQVLLQAELRESRKGPRRAGGEREIFPTTIDDVLGE